MSISRRQFLERAAAAGVLASLPTALVACDDEDAPAPEATASKA